MATKRPKCTRCGKPISGKIKIITYKRKLGKKMIDIVEMYDEKCFLIKDKERTSDGNCKKKSCNKK
jgi:hypothetical protein